MFTIENKTFLKIIREICYFIPALLLLGSIMFLSSLFLILNSFSPINALIISVNLLVFLLLMIPFGNVLFVEIKEKYSGILSEFLPINKQEHFKRNLIHYTSYLTEKDLELYKTSGRITLKANPGTKGNKNLPFQDRSKKFVWFHLSKLDHGYEPNLKSFFQTHYNETNPRKFKVVVAIKDTNELQLYKHQTEDYILIENDIEVKAELFDQFNWYNDRLYLSYTFTSLKNLFNHVYLWKNSKLRNSIKQTILSLTKEKL